jgi:sortase A
MTPHEHKRNGFMQGRLLRISELVLMFAGLLLITLFVVAHLHRALLSRAAVEQFKGGAKPVVLEKSVASFGQKHFTFDFKLWSTDRIAAYKQSLTQHFAPPIAILRIPKLHLEVPVLTGTDDLTLNRAVGLIESSARPGEAGNVAMAGHRDGFFRGLKDVVMGDIVELESAYKIDVYRIDQITVVSPDDVSVLQPTSVSTLTLVTCYPFYFIGSAPKRYIVRSSLVNSGRRPAAEPPGDTSAAHLQFAPQDSHPQSQPRR